MSVSAIVEKTAPAETSWYNSRLGAAGLALTAAGAGYVLALRALDTGSLQQYFLTIVLAIFAVNRLIKTVKGTR